MGGNVGRLQAVSDVHKEIEAMKKAFTLIELLVVIFIIGASGACTTATGLDVSHLNVAVDQPISSFSA